MELIDSTKQIINEILPHRHQWVLASLLAGLLITATVNEFTEQVEPPDSLYDRATIESFPGFKHLKPVIGMPDSPLLQVSSFDPYGTAPDSTTARAVADTRLYLEVGTGDSLSLIFSRAGISAREVQAITNSSPETRYFADLRPGDRLAFSMSSTQDLQSLEIIKSPLVSYVFTRIGPDKYGFNIDEKHADLELVFKETIITDSLFQAAGRGGIPATMAMEVASIFGGVVDFLLDTRAGDSFNLVYEEKYLNGEFVGFGKILAAQFINQGRAFTAIRYEHENGESNFYNPDGESMRKAFLLNPVDFTRISSGFTMARRHPILNTLRAHKGTDYAAPKGTQVVATADGRVTFAGRKGSFGKLVVLQHGDQFETKYAHLNDYAKGISEGVRVKQGQLIGYVGSTGGATGPHLHYEFLMDGVHRNSRTIHELLPQAEAVAASELPRFRNQTQNVIAMLTTKGQSPNALASNSHQPTEE